MPWTSRIAGSEISGRLLVTENPGEGTDTVRTTLLSYTLGANLENLTFIGVGSFAGTGNSSNNIITGGAGNDVLNGLAGNDVLLGGGGRDSLTGGLGADFFKFAAITDSNGGHPRHHRRLFSGPR